MDNETLEKPSKQTDEKFFFHLNVFDQDIEKEEEVTEEDLPPLPPMFSEEELEAVKKQAFEDGKKQGGEEAQKTIQKQTTLLVAQVRNNFSTLLEEEEKREKIFENEAVQLTLSILEKLFPAFQEKYGSENISNTIKTIIQNQDSGQKITVRVAPDFEEKIKALICETSDDPVEVKGCPETPAGACKLEWSDGGAIKDINALSEEIKKTMQQFLEDNGIKSHDHDIKDVKQGEEAETKDRAIEEAVKTEPEKEEEEEKEEKPEENSDE